MRKCSLSHRAAITQLSLPAPSTSAAPAPPASHCSLKTGPSRKRGVLFAGCDSSQPLRAPASSGVLISWHWPQRHRSFRKKSLPLPKSDFCSTSSDCTFIAWCPLAEFWFRRWQIEQGCCGWHSQDKEASCSHAWPSLQGLFIIPCGTVWHWVRSQCALAGAVSQLAQFESCLPHRDQQRAELAACRGCSERRSCKRDHFGRNTLTWCTDISAITIQSRFVCVDSSRLWVPSGIYKTDMLSNNKFYSVAMKPREPTSVWTLAAPALLGHLVALWYFQCAEEVKVK